MSQYSIEDEESYSNETMTIRSGFGRDSFSTPSLSNIDCISRLVEKEVVTYKKMLTDGEADLSPQSPIIQIQGTCRKVQFDANGQPLP